MKKIFLIIAVLLITSCEKNDNDEVKYPSCLKTYIDVFLENNPEPRTPRSTIKKYLFKGNIVYLIDFFPQNPDSGASIVSQNCEQICGLGGIDGNTNDCENWENAEFIETVWTDPR